MPTQTTQTTTTLQLPDTIHSSQAKLVYLYLELTDVATLTDLHRDLNIPKTSLLSILQSLTKRELVAASDQQYRCL